MHSLFTLHDGTPITLTVTAIDSPLVVKFDSGTVRVVGDSVSLGEIPFHADAETQLALPGGIPSGQFKLSFKLSTPSGAYADSVDLTVTFVPRK